MIWYPIGMLVLMAIAVGWLSDRAARLADALAAAERREQNLRAQLEAARPSTWKDWAAQVEADIAKEAVKRPECDCDCHGEIWAAECTKCQDQHGGRR